MMYRRCRVIPFAICKYNDKTISKVTLFDKIIFVVAKVLSLLFLIYVKRRHFGADMEFIVNVFETVKCTCTNISKTMKWIWF